MFRNCVEFAKYLDTLDHMLYKQTLYKSCIFLKHLDFGFLFFIAVNYNINIFIHK